MGIGCLLVSSNELLKARKSCIALAVFYLGYVVQLIGVRVAHLQKSWADISGVEKSSVSGANLTKKLASFQF